VRGGGGGGVTCSRNARWGAGLRGGERVWAKKLKPSCRGSVSGTPCEMAMQDGAYRWCGGMCEVVVVVGSHIRETRGEEQVWVKKTKPSRHGSVSGCGRAAGG
jgi:hypothetical protein